MPGEDAEGGSEDEERAEEGAQEVALPADPSLPQPQVGDGRRQVRAIVTPQEPRKMSATGSRDGLPTKGAGIGVVHGGRRNAA